MICQKHNVMLQFRSNNGGGQGAYYCPQCEGSVISDLLRTPPVPDAEPTKTAPKAKAESEAEQGAHISRPGPALIAAEFPSPEAADVREKPCPVCGWYIREECTYCPGCSKPLPDGFCDAFQAGASSASRGVVDEVAAERQRQIEVEGWTAEHDDKHQAGELATAAACYAVGRNVREVIQDRPATYRFLWPWSLDWWKPKDRRRDLIRAAALIVAEIERHDRALAPQPRPEEKKL